MDEPRVVEPPSLGDVVWVAALLLLWATAPLAVRLAQAWHRRRRYST